MKSTRKRSNHRKINRYQATQNNLIDLLKTEYMALKSEQNSRIQIRENSLYLNFFAIGIVITIVFSQQTPNLLILLSIPVISCTIYASYLNNDVMISSLRDYFETEFPKSISLAMKIEKVNLSKILCNWESYHRSKKNRQPRKILNFLFLLISLLGTSIVSLIITYNLVVSSSLIWLWRIDFLLIITLVVALLFTADI